ncbi:nucleotide binding protein [[Candida] boidinii]|nr:nucleotide binding protein [[Candida] boidinii]
MDLNNNGDSNLQNGDAEVLDYFSTRNHITTNNNNNNNNNVDSIADKTLNTNILDPTSMKYSNTAIMTTTLTSSTLISNSSTSIGSISPTDSNRINGSITSSCLFPPTSSSPTSPNQIDNDNNINQDSNSTTTTTTVNLNSNDSSDLNNDSGSRTLSDEIMMRQTTMANQNQNNTSLLPTLSSLNSSSSHSKTQQKTHAYELYDDEDDEDNDWSASSSIDMITSSMKYLDIQKQEAYTSLLKKILKKSKKDNLNSVLSSEKCINPKINNSSDTQFNKIFSKYTIKNRKPLYELLNIYHAVHNESKESVFVKISTHVTAGYISRLTNIWFTLRGNTPLAINNNNSNDNNSNSSKNSQGTLSISNSHTNQQNNSNIIHNSNTNNNNNSNESIALSPKSSSSSLNLLSQPDPSSKQHQNPRFISDTCSEHSSSSSYFSSSHVSSSVRSFNHKYPNPFIDFPWDCSPTFLPSNLEYIVYPKEFILTDDLSAVAIVYPDIWNDKSLSLGELFIEDHFGTKYSSLSSHDMKNKVMQRSKIEILNILKYLINLLKVIRSIHQHGFTHNGLTPYNLIVYKDGIDPDCNVWVSGFDYAFSGSFELVKTSYRLQNSRTSMEWLPYTAPENFDEECQADNRSDLYSIGVIMYELLIGKLPFHCDNSLGLKIMHMIQRPQAPTTLNENIPDYLSDIVMKLIEKNISDRYQYATFVVNDLTSAYNKLSGEEYYTSLTPLPTELNHQITTKIIGREDVSSRLIEAIHKCEPGTTRSIMITGPSGIGKSRLLKSLKVESLVKGYLFAYWKNYQVKQSISYFQSYIDIINQVIIQIMTGNKKKISKWREKISTKVKTDLSVIFPYVPILEEFLGKRYIDVLPKKQKIQIENYSPAQMGFTLKYIIKMMFAIFSKNGLVLCIDDIQWWSFNENHILEDLTSLLVDDDEYVDDHRLIIFSSHTTEHDNKLNSKTTKTASVNTNINTNNLNTENTLSIETSELISDQLPTSIDTKSFPPNRFISDEFIHEIIEMNPLKSNDILEFCRNELQTRTYSIIESSINKNEFFSTCKPLAMKKYDLAANEMTEFLFKKTQGNILYVSTLARIAAHTGGLISDQPVNIGEYKEIEGQDPVFSLRLDIDHISNFRFSGTLDDFLYKAVSKLPGDSIEVLKFAACICGAGAFSLSDMSTVSGLPFEKVSDILFTGYLVGILKPTSIHYKLPYHLFRNKNSPLKMKESFLNLLLDANKYEFCHESYQTAFLKVLKKDKQFELYHQACGMRLYKKYKKSGLSTEDCYKIAFHFMHSWKVAKENYHSIYCQMLITSGLCAYGSFDFNLSLSYFSVARKFVKSNDTETMKMLDLFIIQTLSVIGDTNLCLNFINEITDLYNDSTDRAQILAAKARVLFSLKQFQEGIDISFEVLELCDFRLEERTDEYINKYLNTKLIPRLELSYSEIRRLEKLPKAKDSRIIFLQEVFNEMYFPCLALRQRSLEKLLMFQSVVFMLDYGKSGFVTLPLIMTASNIAKSPKSSNFIKAVEYCKLALKLAEDPSLNIFEQYAVTYHYYCYSLGPYLESLGSVFKHYEMFVTSSNNFHSSIADKATALRFKTFLWLCSNLSLNQISQKVENRLQATFGKYKDRDEVVAFVSLSRDILKLFAGKIQPEDVVPSKYMADLKNIEKDPRSDYLIIAVAAYSCFTSLIYCKYTQASHYFMNQVMPLWDTFPLTAVDIWITYFGALTLIKDPGDTEAEKNKRMLLISRFLQDLHGYSKTNPGVFESKYLLVRAMMKAHGLDDNNNSQIEILDDFETAIEVALENSLTLEAAIATEHCAYWLKTLGSRSKKRFRKFISEAIKLYDIWGSDVKAAQLSSDHLSDISGHRISFGSSNAQSSILGPMRTLNNSNSDDCMSSGSGNDGNFSGGTQFTHGSSSNNNSGGIGHNSSSGGTGVKLDTTLSDSSMDSTSNDAPFKKSFSTKMTKFPSLESDSLSPTTALSPTKSWNGSSELRRPSRDFSKFRDLLSMHSIARAVPASPDGDDNTSSNNNNNNSSSNSSARLRRREYSSSDSNTEDSDMNESEVSTAVRLCVEISESIDYKSVIIKLLVSSMSFIKADYCCLVLLDEKSNPYIEALGGPTNLRFLNKETLFSSGEFCPTSLIENVIQNNQYINREDDKLFFDCTYSDVDSYFDFNLSNSVLCLPIRNQTELIGALYLENQNQNKIKKQKLFKNQKIDLIQLLCFQAAVSMDKSRLYSQMQIAKKAAEDAMAEKASFLANMSHEIRTPFNSLLSCSIFLLDTELNDIQREYVETIKGSAMVTLNIIDGILAFSKIEHGSITLDYQPFSLNDCIESALQLVSEQASTKSLDLVYMNKCNGVDILMGDITRVRQIIINLAGNAVKFSNEGYIMIESTCYKISEDRYEFTISVKDTGIGMPKNSQNKVFGAFSQVDGSSKREYGGAGLGLAISKKLSELMGGSLTFDSVEGEGSTFWFTLPTKAKKSNVEPIKEFIDKKALIIDSFKLGRSSLKVELERVGYQVTTCDDVDDARLLLRGDFDSIDEVTEDKLMAAHRHHINNDSNDGEAQIHHHQHIPDQGIEFGTLSNLNSSKDVPNKESQVDDNKLISNKARKDDEPYNVIFINIKIIQQNFGLCLLLKNLTPKSVIILTSPFGVMVPNDIGQMGISSILLIPFVKKKLFEILKLCNNKNENNSDDKITNDDKNESLDISERLSTLQRLKRLSSSDISTTILPRNFQNRNKSDFHIYQKNDSSGNVNGDNKKDSDGANGTTTDTSSVNKVIGNVHNIKCNVDGKGCNCTGCGTNNTSNTGSSSSSSEMKVSESEPVTVMMNNNSTSSITENATVMRRESRSVSIASNSGAMSKNSILQTPYQILDKNLLSKISEEYPLSILLAEDNMINTKVALQHLKRMGYIADHAKDGIDVLQLCEKKVQECGECYDIILMDIQMPRMDGIQATYELKKKYGNDDKKYMPKVVALTANVIGEEKKKCLNAGMTGFLTKPLLPNALISELINAKNKDLIIDDI